MQKLYYQFPGTWFGDCMPFGHGDKFYLYLIGRDCDISILGNSDIWQTALVIEPCEINI